MKRIIHSDLEGKDQKSLIRLAHTIYGSFFVGGVPSLIAVIASHMKVKDAEGSWLESHFKWHIRTTWYAVFSFILVLYFSSLDVGTIIIGGISIIAWMLVRNVRGWVRLNDGRAMPKSWISFHPSMPVVAFVLLVFVVLYQMILENPPSEPAKNLQEISLFGLDFNTVKREEVRKVLQGKGFTVFEENNKLSKDTYLSSKVMKGSKTLEATYFTGEEKFFIKEIENQPLIKMEYVFEKSEEIFQEILSKLEKRYGKPLVEKKLGFEPVLYKWGEEGKTEIHLKEEQSRKKFHLTYFLNKKKREMERLAAKEKYRDVWHLF